MAHSPAPELRSRVTDAVRGAPQGGLAAPARHGHPPKSCFLGPHRAGRLFMSRGRSSAILASILLAKISSVLTQEHNYFLFLFDLSSQCGSFCP